MKTEQIDFWKGDFGKEYTDRNTHDYDKWLEFYQANWGLSREAMNLDILENIPKDSRILEVGCNTGMQLICLQKMGFTNLYGIEIQPYAVTKSREYSKGINIIEGSGFDIPFKDGFFDLVCTNGVLIHIAPENLSLIMAEMVRCSKKYILGFEYYSGTLETVNYRGNMNKLWKADYGSMFCENFALNQVKSKFYAYLSDDNVDCMYLLEKQ